MLSSCLNYLDINSRYIVILCFILLVPLLVLKNIVPIQIKVCGIFLGYF